MFKPGDKKYIHFRGEIWELTFGEDLFWRDEQGGIYAYRDYDDTSLDSVDRCGVGRFFSISETDPVTDACGPHEFMYSSRVFQAFHTREEGDRWLESLTEQVPGREFLAGPFYWLAHIFGRFRNLWENPKTR